MPPSRERLIIDAEPQSILARLAQQIAIQVASGNLHAAQELLTGAMVPVPRSESLLCTSVQDMVEQRIANQLQLYGIETAGDLLAHTKQQLEALPRVGETAVKSILGALRKLGLDLY